VGTCLKNSTQLSRLLPGSQARKETLACAEGSTVRTSLPLLISLFIRRTNFLQSSTSSAAQELRHRRASWLLKQTSSIRSPAYGSTARPRWYVPLSARDLAPSMRPCALSSLYSSKHGRGSDGPEPADHPSRRRMAQFRGPSRNGEWLSLGTVRPAKNTTTLVDRRLAASREPDRSRGIQPPRRRELVVLTQQSSKVKQRFRWGRGGETT